MPTERATSSKQFVEEYFAELSGKPKTDEFNDRYVSDPHLKAHIRQFEEAFPSYEIIAEQVVAEGDTVAVRATFRGTHRGAFAGVPPTGRDVSTPVMLFYRIADHRIAQFWMQADVPNLMAQLTSTQ